MQIDILRLQRDGALQRRDGALLVAMLQERRAKFDQGFDVGGIDAQRVLK